MKFHAILWWFYADECENVMQNDSVMLHVDFTDNAHEGAGQYRSRLQQHNMLAKNNVRKNMENSASKCSEQKDSVKTPFFG